MARPYVVRMLVTSGDPDGVLVVDKSNWSGKGVVFARSYLADASDQGLSSPGVYLLIGDDPDQQFDSQIYVGQAENVDRRLRRHQWDDDQDFWEETVVFLCDDAGLGRLHLVHLESRLLELLSGANRALVANRHRTPIPSLSDIDQAEAEEFLSEMMEIFPLLGVVAFVTAPTASAADHSTNRRYFLRGVGTLAEGEEHPDGFLVFAGSKGRIKHVPSLSPRYLGMRKRLVSTRVLVEEGGHYVLTQDHLFGSPSAASTVLLARPSNGRVEWKDAEGVSLKHHQSAGT